MNYIEFSLCWQEGSEFFQIKLFVALVVFLDESFDLSRVQGTIWLLCEGFQLLGGNLPVTMMVERTKMVLDLLSTVRQNISLLIKQGD